MRNLCSSAPAAILAAWLLLLAAPPAASAGLPAFPGAAGWGAGSVGGRGGRILEVTSLADHGPGSLREAIEAEGPRIVVFRVAGYIDLESPLEIVHPYLTIAGQTAPGDGIVLRRKPGLATGLHGALATKRFSAGYAGEVPHDLIIRYLRIRPGRSPTDKKSGGPRPHNFLVYSGHHIIVDHLSSGWTNDNLMTLTAPDNGSPTIHDVSVQRSIFAESFEGHATGMNVQGQRDAAWQRIFRISIHHNLFADNSHRNPRTTSGGTEVINNVAYNWKLRIGSSTRGSVVDWIGNYWKPGPMSRGEMLLGHEARAGSRQPAYPWDPSIHLAGNLVEGRFPDPRGDNAQLYALHYDAAAPLPQRYLRARPLAPPPYPVAVQDAEAAYRSVLADVGANARLDALGAFVPVADAVDVRVLREVAAGTGPAKVLHDESQVGGFPALDPGTPYADVDHDGMADAWELLHFGDLRRGDPRDSRGDLDGDGYTDVEEFLNGTDPRRDDSSGVPDAPQTPNSGAPPAPPLL
jgi:pectate lyase